MMRSTRWCIINVRVRTARHPYKYVYVIFDTVICPAHAAVIVAQRIDTRTRVRICMRSSLAHGTKLDRPSPPVPVTIQFLFHHRLATAVHDRLFGPAAVCSVRALKQFVKILASPHVALSAHAHTQCPAVRPADTICSRFCRRDRARMDTVPLYLFDGAPTPPPRPPS